MKPGSAIRAASRRRIPLLAWLTSRAECVLRQAVLMMSGVLVAAVSAQPVNIPDPALEAAIRDALQQPSGDLTVEDMLRLTRLTAPYQGITNLQGLEAARNLTDLDLSFNALTNLSFPAGLTNLTTMNLKGNLLTELSVSENLPQMRFLYLAENALTDFTFLQHTPALAVLDLEYNDLTSLSLPNEMAGLASLDVAYNRLGNVSFLEGLTNLTDLFLDDNGLRDLVLPDHMTNLVTLTLGVNRFTNFAFLDRLPYLAYLDLSSNRITNNTVLPAGLAFLSWVNLAENQISEFTVPMGLSNLVSLFLGDNPLQTLIMPENLGTNSLAWLVAAMRGQGVSVYLYPLEARLSMALRTMTGSFEFTLTGPPGVYRVLTSPDLSQWSVAGALTNHIGLAGFSDASAANRPQDFYRAVQP